MRKSAFGARVSLLIVLVSICIIIAGHVLKQQICKEIGYGVLGSGIVSFVVTLSEYFASKRETLTQYYLASINTINHFLRCKYAHLTELDYALARIKWNYDAYLIFRKTTQSSFLDDNKDLIEEICKRSNIPPDVPRDDNIIEIILTKFEKRDKELREAMGTYSSLSRYKRIEFENAFGNIYYILNNKKRHSIYTEIHNPIQNKHDKIIECCYHINRYLSNEITNAPVVYKYFNQAIGGLFDAREIDNSLRVYPEFTNSILNNIEKLRCDVFHEEYIPIESKPIYAEFYAEFH